MSDIWVDADACPAPVRDILFRAARRTGIELRLVAARPLRIPAAPNIRLQQVSPGIDAADRHILEQLRPGDLVITADIPLAAGVIERGGVALGPRGELHTAENVREHLSLRNFFDELRSSGVQVSGPAAFGPRERQAFAAQLDRWLGAR